MLVSGTEALLIRLPSAIRFLTLLSLVTRTSDRLWGATRISCVTVKYQCIACWVLRPRGSCGLLTITLTAVLLSGLTTTSAFPFSVFRSSITSTFRLSAYYLVCLRLKKVSYPTSSKANYGRLVYLTRWDSHPLYFTTWHIRTVRHRGPFGTGTTGSRSGE